VNPNGSSTTWYFEYGTSTSYGTLTVVSNAGSGTSAVQASIAINNLTQGLAYHYRIVATNANGTSRGNDGTVTIPSKPTVVTGSATNITTTSCTLNGTVNPNGSSTTWNFEYGTTTSYGTTTVVSNAGSGTSVVQASIAVNNLTPGTLYHYRIVATNAGGNTSVGNDSTVTTLPPPKPTVVTGSATNNTGTSCTLNGTVNPNGSSTTWYFEYGTTISYGTTTAESNAGSGTSAVPESIAVNNLSRGTTYHYRIVAKNAGGTSFGDDMHTVGVNEDRNIILDYHLYQNYPNPFNPTTTIRFTLRDDAYVSLSIYSITGVEVDRLFNGKLGFGEHGVVWNAGGFPSGVYFYRLQVGTTILNQKMLLVK
jgi:phosphodiesterase/alkaline phosphatase D-like protein